MSFTLPVAPRALERGSTDGRGKLPVALPKDQQPSPQIAHGYAASNTQSNHANDADRLDCVTHNGGVSSRSAIPSHLNRDHEELAAIAERQRERIRVLRASIRNDVERRAARRRSELALQRNALDEELKVVLPQVEKLRARWLETRRGSQHEAQWGELKAQLHEIMERNKEMQAEVSDTGTQVKQMQLVMKGERAKLRDVNQSLHTSQTRVKEALESVVVSESHMHRCIQEEEGYLNQLQVIRSDILSDNSNIAQMSEAVIEPVSGSIAALGQYLAEMQRRTRSMLEKCVDLEEEIDGVWHASADESQKAAKISEYFAGLHEVDTHLCRVLQGHLSDAQHAGLQPLSGDDGSASWLRNYFCVWESVKHETSKLLQRAKESEALSVASNEYSRSKGQLDQLVGAGSGEARDRLLLVRSVSNLAHFIAEKRASEDRLEQMIEDIARQSGEPIAALNSFLRREGYDDFIVDSASDSPGRGAPIHDVPGSSNLDPLPEEGFADIDELGGSLSRTPGDSAKPLLPLEPRPRSRLEEFVRQKAQLLKEEIARIHQAQRKMELRGGGMTEDAPTVEEAVSEAQRKVMAEIARFVQDRQQQILSGALDPNTEQVYPDPAFPDVAARDEDAIETYIQMQQTRSRSEAQQQQERLPGPFGGRSSPLSAPHQLPDGGVVSQGELSRASPRKILVPAARIPAEVQNGDELIRAKYFLSCAVRGFNAVVLLPGVANPALRQVFISRDFRWLHVRELGASENLRHGVQPVARSEFMVKVADISNVMTEDAPTSGKLQGDLSFAVHLVSSGRTSVLAIQCDNSESRTFWASVLAWVANETGSARDSIVTRLRQGMRIMVVDSVESTPDSVEPVDRSRLFVQISQ